MNHLKLTEEMLNAVLCYVDDNFAWFTTCDLSHQWGDDWNDAPYEHNAGETYKWQPYMAEREIPEYKVFDVAWVGPYVTPAQNAYLNSMYSVEDINDGDVPWLQRSWYQDEHVKSIYAGTTMLEFINRVYESGGSVYIKLEILNV